MTESDTRWGGRGGGQCMAGQGWGGRVYVKLGSLVYV